MEQKGRGCQVEGSKKNEGSSRGRGRRQEAEVLYSEPFPFLLLCSVHVTFDTPDLLLSYFSLEAFTSTFIASRGKGWK